jgi:hypothetical protein
MARPSRSARARRATAAALAALALGAPTLAYPMSLAQLLQLPLERLLQLEITALRDAMAQRAGDRHGR